MAETIFRGPAVSCGALMDNRVEPFDGPGVEYQGNCFPDVRFGPIPKDGTAPARMFTMFNNPYIVTADGVPLPAGVIFSIVNPATGVAQRPTAAVAPGGTNNTTCSWSPGLSLIPSALPTTAQAVGLPNPGAGLPVTGLLGIDCGFTTGTVTSGSNTVTVPDSTLFALGQWICIGGVGNAGKTLPLFAQVTGAPTATTITIAPVGAASPSASLSFAPISSANLFGSQYQPGTPTPSAVLPYLNGGFSRIFNPLEGLTRLLSITGPAGGTGGAIILYGYDVFGFPMSEQITVAGGSNTVNGKKAWKYLYAAIAQFTDGTHTYTVNTIDQVGIGMRADRWEYTNIFWNGGFATSSVGFTLPDKTNPASTTTGDVRGTINLATLATIGAASDGTRRLTFMQSVPVYNSLFGTPLSATAGFGQTQA